MSKVKKVLSIDMDYIMSPCINLYNDCIGKKEFRGKDFWEKVNEIRGVDQFLGYDEKSLMFVVDLFTKQLSRLPKEAVFFGLEHDMILEFLCADEAKKDFLFDVYNVDHHHDIFYSQSQKEDVERFDFASYADWVYYLGVNSKLEKYHWFGSRNSAPMPKDEITELTFPVEFLKPSEKEKLLDISYDYVFVCKSADFFPPKYQHFFLMLATIAGNVYGEKMDVWSREYCIGGKTRHVL